jgi:hypothetical protein
MDQALSGHFWPHRPFLPRHRCSPGQALCLWGCSAAGRQNLWCYDPETSTWTEMPSAGAPSARGGPAVVATESEIYVFYGFNGTELSDIFALDVNTGSWREVTTTGDIPSPRSVHAAAYLGNRQLFLWGGEGSPSGLGHEGAGKHFGDGFILNLDTTGEDPCRGGSTKPSGMACSHFFPRWRSDFWRPGRR